MRNRPTNSSRDAILFGLTMGTAIGTGIVLTQRMMMRHRMPNLKVWQRALIEKYREVLRRERTKTLGRGDACCDFRYSRSESGKATSGLIQVQSVAKRETK